MTTLKFDKPHTVLLGIMIVLVTLAGFVSHASTKAVEQAIVASASDLLGSRSTSYQWEFLRDGMVFGRILSEEEIIYLFSIRLFGGDQRYAVALQDDGRPRAFLDLGVSPVSPHSARVARVMMAHTGKPLEDSTALDSLIAHTIMASMQTIAVNELSRKEADLGE
ncbi:MAG: hypothetical protein ABIJ86_17035 [Spirochaetota bacterium]